jgi:hypothetical protein
MNCLTKLIVLFFSVIITSRINAQSSENKYLNEVGDIQFDSKIDDPTFKKCNPDESFQYYNFSKGFQYKGEKYEILELFKNLFKSDLKLLHETGYITIRFLVNCEGDTGLFRIQQMNNNYKRIFFNKNTVDTIMSFVKSLNNWPIQEYDGKKVDYYQYLTFKLENGIITEILP